MASRSLLLSWSGVIVLALIWGSTWLAIKLGLEDAPPLHSACCRFIIASATLYFYMILRGRNFPRHYSFWRRTIFLALFMFIIPYGLVYWGEAHISSGLTAILFATQSLFVVVFAHFLLVDERANLCKWLGLSIGMVGLYFVFRDQIGTVGRWGLAGMASVLVAAASGGMALVWLRRMGKSAELVPELTAQLGITALVFTILAFIFEYKQTNWTSLTLWSSIFYLALPGTAFAFVIYYWLAKHTSALIVSFSIFTAPLFAVFLGWFVLGEALGAGGFIGTGFVLLSVIVTQKNDF